MLLAGLNFGDIEKKGVIIGGLTALSLDFLGVSTINCTLYIFMWGLD